MAGIYFPAEESGGGEMSEHLTAADELPGEAGKALRELDIFTAVAIVGALKTHAEYTGEQGGNILCPKCRSGTMKWRQASNGHVRVVCDRKAWDGEFCFNAME